MLFNSLNFIYFLLLTFALYWSVPKRFLLVRNGIVLVASYVFYGFWDWRFLGLIAASTLIDYTVGWQLNKTEQKSARKGWLAISLLFNLGMLGYFKYYNFFAESFADLLAQFGVTASYNTLHIILPVGISFYTFQTLSYTIDIYRHRIKPTKNLLQFAAFVAFFPQLVAGPIERAAHLLPQFATAKTFNYGRAASGLTLVVYGFFKKIVIADHIGALIDPIFNDPLNHFNWEVGLAIVGFTLQIYSDFSAYSDIAIGLAALFGFHLNTNFKTPLFSFTLQEFWQRWHISLSTWFRDYVYIPLGGNRGNHVNWSRNILITFGLSGLWHGAGITFILFGLFHGLYFMWERFVLKPKRKLIYALFTFLAVLFGFLLFRANTLLHAYALLKNLFDFHTVATLPLSVFSFTIFLSLVLFIVLERYIRHHENFAVWLRTKRMSTKIALLYLLVFWTLIFGYYENTQNFIYFQF